MSETTPHEAALALRALSVEHALGPLETVRLDDKDTDRVLCAANDLLSVAQPGEPWGTLAAEGWLPDLLDLAGRLLWSRKYAALRATLRVIQQIGSTQRGPLRTMPPWREVSSGYLALTDLTEFGPGGSTTTEIELGKAAMGLCVAADQYLDEEDHRRVSLIASAALWILFHQELHDARPSSPLVSSPDAWLRPLTTTRMGRLLTGPAGQSRAEPAPPSDPRTQLLVLSGCYPRFAMPVIQELRAEPGLRVTELALSEVDKPFRRMAVEPWLTWTRVRAVLGESIRYEPLLAGLLAADTVLADWADAGAMLASLMKPPRTSLTVRVHSIDALRCWLHLIDWSAVDQLICVGPHIQDLVDVQLGDRVARIPHTVLPNLVHLGRFDHPRTSRSDHTLVMVGWARAVKDPLWTVELLARLRQRDSRWRLLLVGHAFPGVLPPSGRAYADRFTERAMAPDVRGAIEYVAFTEDLAPVLARAGWVVSSSIRESWGVGPMEAVAAGAVPIIRDWPLFARWGGPRRLYPDEWVVDSLEEAERRILQITAAGCRESVARSCKDLLSGLFDPRRTAAGYRDALTTITAEQAGSGV